ncbi:MAG: hypothetical protein WD512_11290 [Candidatus Paceibacterota bacterium]
MKIQPNYTLISIALLLGVVYIAEINNLWVSSYTLADEKKELADSKNYYNNLDTQIAQYSSIGNAIANPDIIAMEKSNFIYLDQNGALVKK